MKYTQILALLLAICVAFAYADSMWEDWEDVEETFSDAGEDLEQIDYDHDLLAFLDEIQTPQQFLALLNPEDFEEDMSIIDEIKATDVFPNQRESTILMKHGLSIEDYDELHSQVLANLVQLSDLLKIEYNPYTTTFSDLMYLIDINIERATQQIQDEATELLMDIRPYSHLFVGRFSLLPAEDEDAVLQAWINVDKAVNKLISVVKSRKCKWCTQLAGYITGKACGKGGKAVCSGLAKLTGKLSKTVNKYVCGSPINLSNLFKNICVSAAKMVSRKSGVTPRNVCKKIKLPTLRWKTHSNKFFHISAKTVVLGRAC